MSRFLWLALAFGLLSLGIVGCEDSGGGLFGIAHTFKNRSSYTVTVTPNGQSTWEGFIIGAGQDRRVTVREDGGSIYFLFSPSDKVYAQNDGNDIYFRNK